MRKNVLTKANLFIYIVIIVGFITTAVTSYHSNIGTFKKDVERVSMLSSEGISHDIRSLFEKPLHISFTMATDPFLKEYVIQNGPADDADFLQTIREYLSVYRNTYHYDRTFFVACSTGRYIYYDNYNRILSPDRADDKWYYSFLESDNDYSFSINSDATSENDPHIYINCKIRDDSRAVIGVVGLGFRADSLQKLLKNYENRFDMKAYLTDKDGRIQISADQTGLSQTSLFAGNSYPGLKDRILSDHGNADGFWYSSGKDGYVVTRYIEEPGWHLITDYDTTSVSRQLNRQFIGGILVIIIIVGLVLMMITDIIHKFNAQIIELTTAREQEHHRIFQTETEKLYEDIYEIDLTHNRAGSTATMKYFESLGVPEDVPFDQALEYIAQKQIKPEHRQGYIDTFSPSNVLNAYKNGIESLCYDFMITNDANHYYWMRITARIFYWEDDKSIRMFIYRQNIDPEKQRERKMMEQMQRDSLSNLYNKSATQDHIQKLLLTNPGQMYAFFILDIDSFKQVNDQCGHMTGDQVILDFSDILRAQFRSTDIVGRIGGDEFVAFVPAPSREWILRKAQSLVDAIRSGMNQQHEAGRISVSIGVAAAPESGTDFEMLYRNADIALYHTKENGKDGYTLYPDI